MKPTSTFFPRDISPVAHVGRRMGVVVCWDKLDADQQQLRDKCVRLASKVVVK